MITTTRKTNETFENLCAFVTLSLAIAFAGRASAEEPEYVEVPPPPARVEVDEANADPELEPDVTIIQRKDATVEEYRVNGKLYMIKITPVVGKPYYLVDKNGDGLMESKMSDVYNDPRVPQWVIFSW